MSGASALLLHVAQAQAALPFTARRGIVRGSGRVVSDDGGTFHPLGLTFFWGVYGWKYERDRVLEHLRWLQPKRFDYLRLLCEVDWTGRSIEPWWPDYPEQLTGMVDAAYDHGLRSELTIVGGQQYADDGTRRFVPTDLARQIAGIMVGREHKLMHYEMANEYDRLNKVAFEDLIAMASVVVGAGTPNLIALSRPKAPRESDEESGFGPMRHATAAAGANAFTVHPRRSDHEYGWDHVSQGYDFKELPSAASNNEPQGPQSSVKSMDHPLLLAMTRALGVVCGGALYVLHVGQGVTGIADPAHGRPENMWEVPNIDAIMAAVRGVDLLLPDGVENWRVVNNGSKRPHPLPLPETGFWYEPEAANRAPALHKNYAALHDKDFVVPVIGLRSVGETGPVPVGVARAAMHVEAFDPVTRQLVDHADLAAGQSWSLPGRQDTLAGYIIRGRYS